MDATEPPQEPVFNWELCADLHNRILDSGWALLTEETGWEQDTSSWWEHYFGNTSGDDTAEDNEVERQAHDQQLADELRSHLHPDVVRFLKKARHDYPGTTASCHFFYYLGGLVDPKWMLKVLKNDDDTGLTMFEPATYRYVNLYNIPDHVPGGLMLDQWNMKSVIIMNNDINSFGFPEEPPWVPLEEILISFVEMIEQKRITAISIYSDLDNPEEPREWEDWTVFHTPWVLSQDDDQIVDDTIAAWNGLLSAIEARIPESSPVEEKRYRNEDINKCDLHGFFIKKFITKARIPSFRFVAPGLRLAASEELADQPFKNADLEQIRGPDDKGVYVYKWYPFLFLRADQQLSGTAGRLCEYPWGNSPEFSTGLYLSNTKTVERADGCRLLLPFSINAHQQTRFGDGKVLPKFRGYDGLYQPGWSLVGSNKNLRLEQLLKNWTSMVENGSWEVDENGVAGGIEKFKEADTEGGSSLYWIKRAW